MGAPVLSMAVTQAGPGHRSFLEKIKIQGLSHRETSAISRASSSVVSEPSTTASTRSAAAIARRLRSTPRRSTGSWVS